MRTRCGFIGWPVVYRMMILVSTKEKEKEPIRTVVLEIVPFGTPTNHSSNGNGNSGGCGEDGGAVAPLMVRVRTLTIVIVADLNVVKVGNATRIAHCLCPAVLVGGKGRTKLHPIINGTTRPIGILRIRWNDL
jgi:hypothetical protein